MPGPPSGPALVNPALVSPALVSPALGNPARSSRGLASRPRGRCSRGSGRLPRPAHRLYDRGCRRPAADPAAKPGDAWGGWLSLASGDGLAETDPRAISVRHELPGGRVYGTSSVSYVAFGPAGIRYGFEPVPGLMKLRWLSGHVARHRFAGYSP